MITIRVWALAAFASLAMTASATAMPVGYNDDGGRFEIAGDALSKADIQLGRFGVYWSTIEPNQGEWDFSYTDQVVASLEARGIRPVLGVSGSPPWANGNTAGISCPCDRAADPDWQAMWARVAQRYPAAVLSVWNEPNFAAFGPVSATRMAELTNSAAAAIWSVNPNQTVLAPPIAPIEYWRQYAREFYPRLDPRIEVAANFYPYGRLRHNFAHNLDEVRQMAAGRPLWITEINTSRSGAHPVSPRIQARFLEYAYSLARSKRVKGMIIHRLWSPYAPDDALFSWDSGNSALRQNGTATRLFNTVRTLHGGHRRPVRLRPIPTAEIPPITYPLTIFRDPSVPVCHG